jgi:hypothetical protein
VAVERLLQSPVTPTTSQIWRALLLPQSNSQQVQAIAGQLDNWLRALPQNVPYDRMVRTAHRPAPRRTAAGVRPPATSPAEPTPPRLLPGQRVEAENLATSTSRIFLGVKLECAQCHDHPFAKWKRTQFWEYAAFFAGVKPLQPQAGVFSQGQDTPTTRGHHPRHREGGEGEVPRRQRAGLEGGRRRVSLAAWLTSANNPYFAEAAVNKVWALLRHRHHRPDR